MARVMLMQPWNFHDENVKRHDPGVEWRNGPYSLLILGTELRKRGHAVRIVDLGRDMVLSGGNVRECLESLEHRVTEFRPDLLGWGFFSVHYLEAKKAVAAARRACERVRLAPIFIAGGIHASTEPLLTLRDLEVDYAFVGEADLGILRLADGQDPEGVAGVIAPHSTEITRGDQVPQLDELPFPDWSLCDYRFYSQPSFARLKVRKTQSLDLMMGRGCVHRCRFCAYSHLSKARFYSADYLADQIDYMVREFGVTGVYFIDSSIGNNRRLLRDFCEVMLMRNDGKLVEWYANMRANQVDEDLLKLMWAAGCRFLFYGFESGSQRVLDLMAKGVSVDHNYRTAELHNKLRFPYNASMLLGYPGEREEDILLTMEFLRKTTPPSVGVNWYVPLPGSQDYAELKEQGAVNTDDPMEWRRIGEVNSSKVYSDVPEARFRELFTQAEKLANQEIPRAVHRAWRYDSPSSNDSRLRPVRKIIRSIRSRLQNTAFPDKPVRPGSGCEGRSPRDWLDQLRKKWSEVPAAVHSRVRTDELLGWADDELLGFWQDVRSKETTGDRFAVRGWYHLLYRDFFRDKKVMDVGCGLGIDGLTFAQHGARVTFVDIVESNLRLVERLSILLGIVDVDFCHMEDLHSLSRLPRDYDVIWCQGSLINAPFEVVRTEAQELLKHLPLEGRWIELAYPKTRWEREGRVPFDRWGEHTDGTGTPWIEWYDLSKTRAMLHPAQFDVVLYFEFHNSDFNWFDLIRRT